MKRASWLILLGVAALAGGLSVSWGGARAEDKPDEKGTVVDLDGMKSRAPEAWQKEEPANRMREMQFKLPRAEGDKKDAEVVIFKLGGTAKDNVKRWQTQFLPPEGKTIDDVSKVTEMKVGDANVTELDVHGTYLFNPAPFNPSSKPEKLSDYRMLGVIFETPKHQYQIRLVGPAKTVEQYEKGFNEWVKNFK